MIAIVNIGLSDDSNPLGEASYEIRINRDVVATFKHHRSKGLSACLMEAAKAVEKQKWEDAIRILREEEKR